MSVSTFIIEWDTDSLCSLVIAEEALRKKAAVVRQLKTELADRQYNQISEMAE